MQLLKKALASLAALGGLALLFFGIDMWDDLGAYRMGARLARHQASPQWQDGKFSNHLPEQMHVHRMLSRLWSRSKDANAAPGAVPVAATDPASLAALPVSGLRITWFGHSTALIEIDGVRVLLDPNWGERASPSRYFGPKRFYDPPIALEQLPRPDAVILSHDHYDHLDAGSIRRMAAWDTRFIVPLGLGAHLAQWGVPESRIHEKDWWEETHVQGLTLACVPARHFSGRMLVDKNHTLWCGWALVGPRHRVYVSGDTAYFHGFKEIGERYGPFDASMVEVGSYDPSWADVHVGPEQAVQAQVDARGGLMLPVHWATYNLALHGWTEPVERVLVAAKKAGVRVAVPRPGQSVEPSAPPALERWWPELKWQTAEEAPVRSSGL